jgi:homoaconitase/3-isopropylmalate dehydratase large subunit
MGSRDSDVYLAGPAVVAASATAGRLAHPATIMEGVEPCLTEI